MESFIVGLSDSGACICSPTPLGCGVISVAYAVGAAARSCNRGGGEGDLTFVFEEQSFLLLSGVVLFVPNDNMETVTDSGMMNVDFVLKIHPSP